MNIKKRSVVWICSKEELNHVVSISFSYMEVLRRLGFDSLKSGPYIGKIKRRIQDEGISVSHFKRNGIKQLAEERLIQDWIAGKVSGLRKDGKSLSNTIRRYLLKSCDGTCSKCGWGKKHSVTGKYLVQIHHKDGKYNNCAPDNLEVLCPNCHTETLNYGSRNKGNGRPR